MCRQVACQIMCGHGYMSQHTDRPVNLSVACYLSPPAQVLHRCSRARHQLCPFAACPLEQIHCACGKTCCAQHTFPVKGDARAALPARLYVHAQRFLHITLTKLSTQAVHLDILFNRQQLTQLQTVAHRQACLGNNVTCALSPCLTAYQAAARVHAATCTRWLFPLPSMTERLIFSRLVVPCMPRMSLAPTSSAAPDLAVPPMAVWKCQDHQQSILALDS